MTDAEREDMVCRTCVWFRPRTDKEMERDGSCRRLPPVLVVLGGEATAGWPAIDSNNWCGEWRRAAS